MAIAAAAVGGEKKAGPKLSDVERVARLQLDGDFGVARLSLLLTFASFSAQRRYLFALGPLGRWSLPGLGAKLGAIIDEEPAVQDRRHRAQKAQWQIWAQESFKRGAPGAR